MTKETTDTLLVELLTEELPPKSLAALSTAFSNHIAKFLQNCGLCTTNSKIHSFYTPRRLAVTITNVLNQAPNQNLRTKILPISIAFENNKNILPSKALIKKLESYGHSNYSLEQLEHAVDGYIYISRHIPGALLRTGLQEALDSLIANLPIARLMNYQLHNDVMQNVCFIRPVHKLIAMHGRAIIPVMFLGLAASNETLGHRFLACHSRPIIIDYANNYAKILLEQGKVIADASLRRDTICNSLLKSADQEKVLMPVELLDEVISLVEWPIVYSCNFDEKFLAIPSACLILTMQTHQKYFALLAQNEASSISSRFLVVSNIETDNPEEIILGNERVLRARLNDAQFFINQDKRKKLFDYAPDLAKVVYHNKLGSQLDRCKRIEKISTYIAKQLSYTSSVIDMLKRAATIIKADLLTNMVGEFPSLQGIIGQIYATESMEAEAIAIACYEHYQPRFAKDSIPNTELGLVLALADKLEAIVGIFGIGIIPSGEKDPYGLRRHALGIARILIEKNLPLNLVDLLQAAKDSFGATQITFISKDIFSFIVDRLPSYLSDTYGANAKEISAVLAKPDCLHDLRNRLLAVQTFIKLPQAPTLIAANKRIANILQKFKLNSFVVNANKLEEQAEKNLYHSLNKIKPEIEIAFNNKNYNLALDLLTKLSQEIDIFFADVMVMSPNIDLRNNRCALLGNLFKLMNHTADIKLLA